MKIKINKNLAGSSIFLITALILWLLIPSQVKVTRNSVINAQTFPKLVIGLMGILSIILLIKTLVSIIRKEKQDIIIINVREELNSWLMILNIILFWIILHFFSFLASAIIFSTLTLLLFRCKKWQYYLITYFTISVIVYVFKYALDVKLP